MFEYYADDMTVSSLDSPAVERAIHWE